LAPSGETAALPALRGAGVSAVSLANNHALDAGEAGLARTGEELAAARLRPLGLSAARTGRPVAERLGELAVVAANLTPAANPPGAAVPIPSPAALGRAIAAARRADPARPILVLLHAGPELRAWVTARDQEYATSAVRAGAAAVVMHGAHVVRPLVRLEGVPVHYGLGNLLFDQRAPTARRGELLRLRFEAGRPALVEARVSVDALTGGAAR